VKRFSLVVTDVDGTLLTPEKALTPRAIAAVGRLREAGIAFSICSSRPPFGLRMLIEPLQLQLPLGGYNAGSIVLPDLSVVEQQVIPPAAAREAVELFRQHRIDCWVFTGNQWVVANPEGDHVDLETRTVQQPPTVVREFEDRHFAAVGKIVGPSKDHGLVARMEELLQEALGGSASVMRSQPYYCDITPPGVDKGRLVELLAERLAVPRSEIMVLGDMENDLEMFHHAGFAVAMGNATDEVKRAAQATTLANDEDGFAVAVERYALGV
jgi:hypothetical protein